MKSPEEFADEMRAVQESPERGSLWRRRVDAIRARDAEHGAALNEEARAAGDVDFQRAILADRRDAEDELAKVAGLVRGSTNGTYTDVEFETLALAWLAEFDASSRTVSDVQRPRSCRADGKGHTMRTARDHACRFTSISSKLACPGNDGGPHSDVCDLLTKTTEARDDEHGAEVRSLLRDFSNEAATLRLQVREMHERVLGVARTADDLATRLQRMLIAWESTR